MAAARVRLTDISSRAWEHPADRGALVALRKLRGFDTVLRKVSGLLTERALRMILLGSAVRVDEHQLGRVYRCYTDAAAALDVRDLPDLYVSAAPLPQASTIGLDKPVIVVGSASVNAFTDDELRFVLGHELGHVQSGHAVYKTLLTVLVRLSTTLFAVPIGLLGARAIMAGLMEWNRKSELSADRAGLLAAQDVQAAQRAFMKLASGCDVDGLDAAAFLQQAGEYSSTDDVRDIVLRALVVEQLSHPFAVVRAGELQRWVDSGAYTAVLAGDYPKRADDATASVSAEALRSAKSYGESFRQADEFIRDLVDDLGAGLSSVKDWVSVLVRDVTGRRRES